jgi:hypothetical protein
MRPATALHYLRPIVGILGLCALAIIVRAVGVSAVVETLRGAAAWLPVLCLLEAGRIAAEATASYFAFGSLAPRIPVVTLLRAHLLGHAIGAVAPAPTVFNETIKATLLAPFAGAPAAASVAVINQAATLMAGGFFSIPCAFAIYALGGESLWLWACAAHAVVLVTCGVGLRALSRAGAARSWIASKVPRLAERIVVFHVHATEAGLLAAPTTGALFMGRAIQALQYGVAARAVGGDATFLHAMAAQGVNLLAAAVGVLVPGGLGTTDGAFTLAAHLLGVTAARATSLALLMRCVQIVWLLIASVLALLGSSRRTPGDVR